MYQILTTLPCLAKRWRFFTHSLAPVLLLVHSTIVFASAPADSVKYRGSESCAQCHAAQVALWQGSHHDLAMQHADTDTVLADFSDVSFSYSGITTTFYKKNNSFMVRTDGPDGRLHDYEVKYTFGVTPLQQYLVELENGKLQALSIAWDSRSKPEGGQRWFHLYPDESIRYDDELHWTGANFNWNGMCAECHSTNLQKNYNSNTDTFKTSWSEIDVSCEACHGPASNHLIWATKQTGAEKYKDNKGFDVLFDERKDVHWQINAQTGNAMRNQPRETQKEIDVCAQCHSRRSPISDDYQPGKPFLDHYKPRLLDEGMYYADGQIQDEVYVYGSFLQSRMYHQGVTCSDCHEPHSLRLKKEGNGVCLQCHSAQKFDSKKHHFHETATRGASCAECHMPPTTYMVVDPRHDHSIRIPRPDLSVSLGTPNACNQCHADRDADWAAKQVLQWYGKQPQGFQQYAEAITAGRQGSPNADRLLVDQINKLATPDIARASAMAGLAAYLDQSSLKAIEKGLQDESALVRAASLGVLDGVPASVLVPLAFPLLDDPARLVRIEAARVLAAVPVGQLEGEQLKSYEHATKEYLDSQLVNADRTEAQFNLGNFYAAKNEFEKAELAYQQSIKRNRFFVPAYINLADLYRLHQGDEKAEKILQQVLSVAPDNADVHYALGLSLIRQKQNKKAVALLQHAAELDASNAHYIYVYAVALDSTGENEKAIAVLEEAHGRFKQNRDILEALVAFHRDAGNQFAAQTYMNKLKKLE